MSAAAADAAAATPAEEEASRLRAAVSALEAEVAFLQGKLAELHGSDVVALRRAHASLAQHVTALSVESADLAPRLAALETALWDPRLAVREATLVAACCGGAYALHALLQRERGMPLWLRLAPYALAGSYAALHVVAGVETRWVGMARRNAERKKGLLLQAALLGERIDIMCALAQPPPPLPPSPEPPAHIAVALGVPEPAEEESGELVSLPPSALPSGPDAV